MYQDSEHGLTSGLDATATDPITGSPEGTPESAGTEPFMDIPVERLTKGGERRVMNYFLKKKNCLCELRKRGVQNGLAEAHHLFGLKIQKLNIRIVMTPIRGTN